MAKGNYGSIYSTKEYKERYQLSEEPWNVSLRDIINFNKMMAGDNSTNVTDALSELSEEQYKTLQDANLHLGREDLKRLDSNNVSERKVYNPDVVAYIGMMKREFDDRGWNIKRFELSRNNEGFNAIVSTGSGDARIVMASPIPENIGKAWSNGLEITRRPTEMYTRGTHQNGQKNTAVVLKANGKGKQVVMAPLDYMFGSHDNAAHAKPTVKNQNKIAMSYFEKPTRSQSGNSNYEKVHEGVLELQKENPQATLQDLDLDQRVAGSNQKMYGTDGVFYVEMPNNDRYNGYGADFGLATEQEPKTMREIVEYAYDRARRDAENELELERRVHIGKVDDLEEGATPPEFRASKEVQDRLNLPNADLLFNEDGDAIVEYIDFDTIKQYFGNDVAIVNAIGEEQGKFLAKGGTVKDFRQRMLKNYSTIAQDMERRGRVESDVREINRDEFVERLQSLNGIGPVYAENIADYFNNNTDGMAGAMPLQERLVRYTETIDEAEQASVLEINRPAMTSLRDLANSQENEFFRTQSTVNIDDDEVAFDEDNTDELLGADEPNEDLDGTSSANLSTRQYLLNLTPGLTDEDGTPHVGWLPEEKMTSYHEHVIELARQSSEQVGVKDFSGRFDNDGVLHWSGESQGFEVNHKLGQFFFPATEAYPDPETGLEVKPGMIRVERPGNPPQYRVNLYDITFVSPSPRSTRADGELSHYNSSLLERVRMYGYDNALEDEVSRSIRMQAFALGENENAMFDATRARGIISNRTQPVTIEAAQRPNVIRHMQNQGRIDDSWADRLSELNVIEASKDGEDPEVKLENLRYLMTENEMSGVFSMIASSDGGPYGKKLVLTEEMIEYLEEFGDDPEVDFRRTGSFGRPGRHAGTVDRKTKELVEIGEKRLFQREFLEVSDERKQALIERYPDHLTENSTDQEFRHFYKSPLEETMSEHVYADHDASDRQGQVLNLYADSKEIIGGPLDPLGRDKPKVALYTVSGANIEDGLIINGRFAETYHIENEDKLSDAHNNKGTVGYISGKDPEDPLYNPQIEALFEANPELDVIQSPYSVASRANTGLLKELGSGEIQPLIDPETNEPLVDVSNEPVVMGEYTVFVTKHTAYKKNKHYGLQNSTKDRHVSVQQAMALEANDAKGVYEEIFSENDRDYLRFEELQNSIGYHTNDFGVLLPGYRGMGTEPYSFGGKVTTIEEPVSDVLALQPNELLYEDTDGKQHVLYPEESAYIELPIMLDSTLSTKNDPVYNQHVAILPERLRKGMISFDGSAYQHNYDRQMNKILESALEVENEQLLYLKEHLPEELKNNFNVEEPEDIDRLVASNDKDFRVFKAQYDYPKAFEELNDPTNKQGNALATGLMNLKGAVADYHHSIHRDHFGVDERSRKASHQSRKLVSTDVKNAATLVISNNTNVEFNTISISPLSALNAGLIKLTDKQAQLELDDAILKDDVEAMYKAVSGVNEKGERKWENAFPAETDAKEYGGEGQPRVMLWRDPVLHGPSVLGVKYQIDDDRKGIGFNPAAIGGTGADYDGDSVALVYPKTTEAQRDLRTNMSVERHLIGTRKDFQIIKDTDVALRFSQSDKAEKLRRTLPNGKEMTGKQLVGEYLQQIKTFTNGQRMQMQDANFKKFGIDPEEYDRLAIKRQRQNNKNMNLTPDEAKVLGNGDFINKRVKEKETELFAKHYSEFVKEFVQDKDGKYKGRTLNFSDRDSVERSIVNMKENGEKGKDSTVKEVLEYYDKGVGIKAKTDRNVALSAKADMVGLGGANSKDGTWVLNKLRHHHRVTNEPVLMNGQLVNRNIVDEYNGPQLAMTQTEVGTQVVLSIKKSPAEVPIAANYLKNNSKAFKGSSQSLENMKMYGPNPVFVEVDRDQYRDEEIRFTDLVPGKDEVGLDPNARQRMMETARKIDQFVYSDSPVQKLNLDINTGLITSSKRNPEQGAMFAKGHPKDIYTLAMLGNSAVSGMDCSYKEAEMLYAGTRNPETGTMYGIEDATFENARPMDYLSRAGVDGMRRLAQHNMEYRYETEHQKSFANEKDEYGALRAPKSFKDINDIVKENMLKSPKQYELQRESLIVALDKASRTKEDLSQELFMEEAEGLGLEIPEDEMILDLGEALKENDLKRQQNREQAFDTHRATSINRELNGAEFVGDYIDTDPGYGSDGIPLENDPLDITQDLDAAEEVFEYVNGNHEPDSPVANNGLDLDGPSL